MTRFATTEVRAQWDWLKYNIRKETIQYCKEKARQPRETIGSIEHDLKLAAEEQAETLSVENFNRLENLKTEFEKEDENITRGAIVRSQVNWYDNGEKNNKAKSTIRKTRTQRWYNHN